MCHLAYVHEVGLVDTLLRARVNTGKVPLSIKVLPTEIAQSQLHKEA